MREKRLKCCPLIQPLNKNLPRLLDPGPTFIKTRISLEESRKYSRICSEDWKTIEDLSMNMKKTQVKIGKL